MPEEFAQPGLDERHPLLRQRYATARRLNAVKLHIRHVEQPGGVRVICLAFPARPRPHLVRLAAHEISLAIEPEDQRHTRQEIHWSMARPKRVRRLLLLCRLAEQGEGHGAEDGGLAGARRPVDAE